MTQAEPTWCDGGRHEDAPCAGSTTSWSWSTASMRPRRPTQARLSGPPRGFHRKLGTANHLMIFDTDYFEILGIVEDTEFNAERREWLKGGGGLANVALATDGADLAFDGFTAAARSPMRRCSSIVRSRSPAKTEHAQFRTVRIPKTHMPVVGFFVCEHLTPQFVYRSEWAQHPNGARGILGVTRRSPSSRRNGPPSREVRRQGGGTRRERRNRGGHRNAAYPLHDPPGLPAALSRHHAGAGGRPSGAAQHQGREPRVPARRSRRRTASERCESPIWAAQLCRRPRRPPHRWNSGRKPSRRVSDSTDRQINGFSYRGGICVSPTSTPTATSTTAPSCSSWRMRASPACGRSCAHPAGCRAFASSSAGWRSTSSARCSFPAAPRPAPACSRCTSASA